MTISEVHCLSRTSVSIDEAIAMLLGWITGPVRLQSDGADHAADDYDFIHGYAFDLAYRIDDIREGIDADLSGAEDDGRHREATQLRNELEELKNAEAEAFAYRCAIDNELSKGTESELKRDQSLSNRAITYITMVSFDQWAMKHYGVSFLPNNRIPQNKPVTLDSNGIRKPRTRLRDQEKVILEYIKSLELDPLKLPDITPGKPGVKSQAKDKLKGDPLFNGKTTFGKAWERLFKQGDMVYSSKPYSPQKPDGGDL